MLGLTGLGRAHSATHAALYDRGGGLIYDSDQNITRLQDANYAKTSGYDADGQMNWSASMDWANNLSYFDAERGVTYNDWRLPSTSGMEGYNNTISEMGHLYYIGLSNAAGNLENTGPFLNVQNSVYWSSTQTLICPLGYSSSYCEWHPWSFITQNGNGEAGSTDITLPNFQRYSWAVHDGDVAAVSNIPIPTTAYLFGSALFGLATASRRHEKPSFRVSSV